MDEMKAILQTEYGITADNISSAVGGLSASAYKVDSAQGTFWLKAYDKRKTSTIAQLDKLNLCMAVASWLHDNTGLKGKINAPLLTNEGAIKVETQNHAYLVFDYIDGTTICTTPLSINQQKELADIVGELHQYGADMPFDFTSIQENFDIPCTELLKMPRKPNSSFCVYQQHDMLMEAINKAFKLANLVKSKQLPFVLCHADIHGWNLIQNDRLMLIDWESIKFAPAEADLYTFWGDWYWGNSNWGSYWDTFLPVYQKLRPEYVVCEDTLRFYQIRRHIEDIEEFYKEYIYDDLTVEERNEITAHLERECKFLRTLIF